MKNLMLLFVMTSFVTPGFAGAEETRFSCANKSYRDSVLSFNKKTVSIQDSFFQDGSPQRAERVIAERLGLSGDVSISALRLDLERSETMNCTSSKSLVVVCAGTNRWARLWVSGSLHSLSGTYSEVELSIPVEVAGFELNSKITRSALSKDMLNVSAKADLIINRETLKIGWSTWFDIVNANQPQNCSVD